MSVRRKLNQLSHWKRVPGRVSKISMIKDVIKLEAKLPRFIFGYSIIVLQRQVCVRAARTIQAVATRSSEGAAISLACRRIWKTGLNRN